MKRDKQHKKRFIIEVQLQDRNGVNILGRSVPLDVNVSGVTLCVV